MSKRTAALLGLLTSILLAVVTYLLRRRQYGPAPVYVVDGKPFGFRGVMLPGVGIILSRQHLLDPDLMAHEQAHWMQAQRDGPFTFARRYVWWGLRYGYWDNPYEVEARRIAYEKTGYLLEKS
jgi:hypothetical protein